MDAAIQESSNKSGFFKSFFSLLKGKASARFLGPRLGRDGVLKIAYNCGGRSKAMESFRK